MIVMYELEDYISDIKIYPHTVKSNNITDITNKVEVTEDTKVIKGFIWNNNKKVHPLVTPSILYSQSDMD